MVGTNLVSLRIGGIEWMVPTIRKVLFFTASTDTIPYEIIDLSEDVLTTKGDMK